MDPLTEAAERLAASLRARCSVPVPTPPPPSKSEQRHSCFLRRASQLPPGVPREIARPGWRRPPRTARGTLLAAVLPSLTDSAFWQIVKYKWKRGRRRLLKKKARKHENYIENTAERK